MPAEYTIEIERLTHEGRGVGHLGGKTVFVSGALPGELVRARRLRGHARYEDAVCEEVLRPAANRVAAHCAHAQICGGCALQHMAGADQIAHKQAVLLDLLEHHAQARPATLLPPLAGAGFGYRRRARLAVKYVQRKGGVLVGFREKDGRHVADIRACPVLAPVVGERIEALRELIDGLSVRAQVPQLEVAVGDRAAALVVRHLAPLSQADRERLAQFGRRHDLDIWLQPGGLDSVAPLAAPARTLSYRIGELELEFQPTDFTQINQEVNALMVARVIELLQAGAADLVLDLFCGIGNFSLPIARAAGEVLGVEGDPALVQRAAHNARRNGVANARFLAADLARPFAHWPEGAGKVVLDPPRTGALELLQQADLRGVARLIYVSCNPITLARDAALLLRRHGMRLGAAGVMDMFPQTAHVESMAVFDRA